MRLDAVLVGIIGAAALLTAMAAVVRWGSLPFFDPVTERTVGDQLRWWLRLVAVTMLTAIVSGLLVPGLVGRLAMRVIAATAGDSAQGQLTEARELVGEITLGGTIGFVLFVGLFAGGLFAVALLLLRPVLPAGRLGGLLFAVLMLVVVASRIDPLRADNTDFDIVGPDLLSVAIFGTLPLLHGLTVAALAARFSHAVPLVGRAPRTWLPYLALVPALLAPPLAAFFVVVGAIALAWRLARPAWDARSSRWMVGVARLVVAVAAVAALPGFVFAVADILTT